MSLFGKWECPNCGSTWSGSIGWEMSLLNPENKDRLNRLLQTGCGCEPVDDPVYPEVSASCMGFVESEKRKQLRSKSKPLEESE